MMFDMVFGHQRVKDMLGRTLQRDQLHHGLCFYGPAGIGKRLLGQQLARAILCESQNGCGTCKHCHKFDSGNHPDYREVVPDGADIKVDQIREISENLHFRPFEGKARIILIDSADRMRDEAGNAFLKSLEEPPSYVYFILVASDLKAMLATIRSRCQKIGFQSLTDEDKTQILIQRFGKEPAMAQRLARISFRQLETEEEAWDHFMSDTRKALTFFRMMLEEGHALEYFAEIAKDKVAFGRFQDHLLAAVRELTFVSRGMQANPLYHDFGSEVQTLAHRVPSPAWREVWLALTDLAGKRRLNLNLSLWFNALSVTALNLREEEQTRLRGRLQK